MDSHYRIRLSRDAVPLERGDASMELICRHFDALSYCSDDLLSGGLTCTWYSHEEELRELSRAHPDVLFSTFRTGEEPGDIEQMWTLGGLQYSTQAPEWSPPPFDPSRLK